MDYPYPDPRMLPDTEKRKNLVPYEEYMQDRKLWEEDRYTDLYLAIMELPQELRVLVTLYYLDGFSVREVSDILQMKEGTVKAVYQERENSSECSLETGRAYYAREGKMGTCGAGGARGISCKI